MKLKIDVVVYMVDQQDGSYRFSIYNNREELAKGEEFDEEKMQEIEDGDDEYENGVISNDSIEIEIVDGKARLVGDVTFTTD